MRELVRGSRRRPRPTATAPSTRCARSRSSGWCSGTGWSPPSSSTAAPCTGRARSSTCPNWRPYPGCSRPSPSSSWWAGRSPRRATRPPAPGAPRRAVAAGQTRAAVQAGRGGARGVARRGGRHARHAGQSGRRAHPGQTRPVPAVVPAGVRRADGRDADRLPGASAVAARRRPVRRRVPLRIRRGGLAGWINVAAGWLVPYCLGALWARRGRAPRSGDRMDAARRRGRGTARLVLFAGYPASMVGVPGAAISNLNPPTLAAVTFGLAQCGAALLLLGPLRRVLRRPRCGPRWRWSTSPR